jgi:acetyl-CoA C-acetyltransferase
MVSERGDGAAIAANTPVLVAAAAVEQRCEDPLQAREACALMADAVRAAATAVDCPALLTGAERIYVPRGLWAYTDPARLLANAIGAVGARTVFAEFGILQQSLIGDACRRINAGEIDIAIVSGGEAGYRGLRARITGQEIRDTEQEGVAPDVLLEPGAELWSEQEAAAGLGMPVGYYAIMESALRAADGLGVEEHRDRIAAMYQRFSEIAVENPHAWKRQAMPAATIRDPGERNPMLAFPYTKLHNTSWNVDQASALILTSAAKARELGIDRRHWIFPLASTESNHMQCLSARQKLHGCPGAGASARAAFELAGLGAGDITHWDLYSCFPVAVSIYAREAGVPAGVPLTVTGGMPFAGGPLNNYVLQATVRMVEKLREQPGTAMVSSVSGMLTKQAWGLWGTEPGRGFAFADVTAGVRAANPDREVVADYTGSGTVRGYTVLYQGGVAERAVAVVELDDGRRSVNFSQDSTLIEQMQSREYVGRTVQLEGGRFQ